jgi:hypothetical protein
MEGDRAKPGEWLTVADVARARWQGKRDQAKAAKQLADWLRTDLEDGSLPSEAGPVQIARQRQRRFEGISVSTGAPTFKNVIVESKRPGDRRFSRAGLSARLRARDLWPPRDGLETLFPLAVANGKTPQEIVMFEAGVQSMEQLTPADRELFDRLCNAVATGKLRTSTDSDAVVAPWDFWSWSKTAKLVLRSDSPLKRHWPKPSRRTTLAKVYLDQVFEEEKRVGSLRDAARIVAERVGVAKPDTLKRAASRFREAEKRDKEKRSKKSHGDKSHLRVVKPLS